jgi:phosphoribosylanthranilate isomerase
MDCGCLQWFQAATLDIGGTYPLKWRTPPSAIFSVAIQTTAQPLQTIALPSQTPLIKICGVTLREQAMAIAEMGADFIGINLWSGSKRYLPLEKAVTWMAEVPSPTRLVGVFVNPDHAYVAEAVSTGLLSYVQLHGDEPPDFCAELAERGVRVLKAIQVRDEASLEAIEAYAVNDILLDAYHPRERGGIGEKFPWELALAFKRRFPERNLWLAGGLTPGNVGEAVRGVKPHVVDVASGVEGSTAGVKDMEKVAEFLREARRAAPGERNQSA